MWCWLLAHLTLAVSSHAQAITQGPPPEPYRDKESGNFFDFKTRPDIEAPKWRIDVYDDAALQQDQYWFISPYHNLFQKDRPMWNGPLIYRPDGELIWSGASYNHYYNAHDFRVSVLDKRGPMLSVVWPNTMGGHVWGWFLDHTYTLRRKFDLSAFRHPANMHELQTVGAGKSMLAVTGQNTSKTWVDHPDYSGECQLGHQGFKEFDTETGNIIFEWASTDWIGPDESTFVSAKTANELEAKCSKPWDFIHFNSVDKFPDGDYLLSGRHTNTLYKISHLDGSIVWRMGGSLNNFTFEDTEARFSRQHHARIRGDNATHTLISLFNNAVGQWEQENASGDQSKGLLLAIRKDVSPMTVSLATRFKKPTWNPEWDGYTFSDSRGSVEFLDNGNAFVGWVKASHISEHAPDGRVLMQAVLAKPGADTYRSYKMPWVGRPADPPDVVAEVSILNHHLCTVVWVSWNGATEVARWNLLHTNEAGNRSELVGTALYEGFETRIQFEGYLKHAVLVALDARGYELGRSKVVDSRAPATIDPGVLESLHAKWLATPLGRKWPTTAALRGHSWLTPFIAGVAFTLTLHIGRKRVIRCLGFRRQPVYKPMFYGKP